jgi:hypothetical protein
MEYGLRRYEATQRLLWFLFFLLCLAIAYPVAKAYQLDFFGLSSKPGPFHPDAIKSSSFWLQFHWLQMQPLGNFTIYIIWVAILFLAGRLIWLITQLVGKQFVRNLLVSHVKRKEPRVKPVVNTSSAELERSFPSELLYAKADRFLLQLLFHPFQRLRLMLTNPQRTLSSEELMEKERRIVETDWHILWSSWTPYRWLLWLLPLLGLVQAMWLLYIHLQPTLSGQKELQLQELFGPVLTSLLPLVQLVIITVLFSLASGLLKRFENLYLSSVDGLFYDQFLSRLPFQSSDTLIILEAMERQFQELRAIVRRLERPPAKEEGDPEEEA